MDLSGIKKQNRSILLFFLADILILILCYANIYLLTEKASLPFKLLLKENFLIASTSSPDGEIRKYDQIIAIDKHKLYSNEEIELLLDKKNKDQQVEIIYSRQGITNSVVLDLTPYYTSTEIIAYAFIGTLFILIGSFIFYKCYDLKSARVFHWVSVATGMVIMMTPGYFNGLFGFGYLIRLLFHVSYSLVPAIYIHFTIVFPVERDKEYKVILLVFYSLSVLSAVVLNAFFLNTIIGELVLSIKNFLIVYNVFRIYVIVSIITAILIFARSYRLAVSVPEKKKLKWLLYGFLIGPFTYLIFWVVPYLIIGKGLIPEIIIILMLSAVPITFTIAIAKYHLMDIDLIINRSIVYTLVLGSIIGIYTLLVSLISDLITSMNVSLSATVSAVAVALLFQPAKNRIQKYVDKYFFRVQYDFREALRNFLLEIKNIARIDILAKRLVERTNELIPVEKIAYFTFRPDNRISILSHNNFDKLFGRSLKFEEEKLKTNLSQPVALIEKIEPGVDIEAADRTVFRRWGMTLVFPVKSASGIIYGFFVLGEKKSGVKFTAEDVDLLNTVINEVALTIERIKLQEDLLIEHLEKEKLNELNEMKSFFVSSVSHDLKTPLTSIKIFTDLLIQINQSSQKSLEYLNIIEGESSRLTRLIDNVLDYTKIEKGVKDYNPEKISLEELLKETLEIMKYQVKMYNFEIQVSYHERDNFICADKDSIKEALINIISNALKYSLDAKKIVIRTFNKNGYAGVDIEDNGLGISEADLQNIFEPFFRSKYLKGKKAGGTGIGLSIVKHIMDAHKGKIEVKSELGKGSCFTLLFPLNEFS